MRCGPTGSRPNAQSPNYQTFQARYNHNHQVIFSATRPSGGTTGWTAGSQYFYDAQNRLSRQVEGGDGASEHLIYLEGYEDRVGGYRTRSYVDDYAHLTRYRYGQLELRFVLTDRLGSVVSVVRADRDSGGYVTALEPETGLAYDVFGAPRHATTWAGLGANQEWPQARNPWDVVTPTTRHGFTGHEMLSKQRLIHMRGRLFDPRMGRFTGVDPVIQFPLSTQGLNPYSYLLNNPLAGTDPTGYATCKMSDDKSCLEDGVNTVVDDKGNKSTVIVGQKGDNIAITGTMDVSKFKYISSDINLAFNPSNGADDWVKNGPKGSSDIGSASERGKGCAGNGPIQCYRVKSDDLGDVKGFERTFETSGGVGAVNGMLNNIGKALTLMSGHINDRFGPTSNFLLAHNPTEGFARDTWESTRDKFGFTTAAAGQLSEILAGSRQSMDWLAHSQGGILFSEAVRVNVAQGWRSSVTMRVAFDSGANNKWVTNRYLARAGIDLFGQGYFDPPNDLVPQIVGLRAWNRPDHLLRSLISAPSLFGPNSPHTHAYTAASGSDP